AGFAGFEVPLVETTSNQARRQRRPSVHCRGHWLNGNKGEDHRALVPSSLRAFGHWWEHAAISR
ncbi:hypothetical protein, partial [Rhizobium ruizarguesonis]|uniref:hypothetical protein n=1 Tax=Rhizobium ruizarguesonis TaxID=2081791 RepID=UPI001A8F74B1